MVYLLIYLAVGLVAFCWALGKENAKPDDYLIPFILLADPIGLLAWLVWPVSLLVYRLDLKEKLRAREKSRNLAATKPPDDYAGRIAEAITRMSPSGKVDVEGRAFEAISEDGYIEAGTSLVVMRNECGVLRVRKMPNKAPL